MYKHCTDNDNGNPVTEIYSVQIVKWIFLIFIFIAIIENYCSITETKICDRKKGYYQREDKVDPSEI